MIRAIAFVAVAFAVTVTTVSSAAHARVTYGMNGNATYNGSGTADCADETTVSFDCPEIEGVNPFQSGDFMSSPGSAGMQCAEAACAGHGGVVLSSVVFEVDQDWREQVVDAHQEERTAERLDPAAR